MAEDVLKLLVTAGNALGAEIKVQDELAIGRQEEGVGKLSDDVEISRRHAHIARSSGGFVIEDLGSTNGTIVNGSAIAQPHTLRVGDTVEMGGTTLLVELAGAPTPATGAVPAETAIGAQQPRQPEPAPEPPPVPAPAAASATPPPLKLRIEVDVESGEASVMLDDDADPVYLVHADGRWQLAEE